MIIVKLLLALMLSSGLISCAAEDYATPEEKIAIEEQDQVIKQTEARLDAKIAEVKDKASAIEKAFIEDPDKLPTLVEEYEALVEEAKRIFQELELALAGQEERLKAIKERTIGVVTKASEILLGSTGSPLTPLIPLIGLLGAQLAFKRSRQHLWMTAKALAKLQLSDAVLAYLKSLGLKHSENRSTGMGSLGPLSQVSKSSDSKES
jgi:hypothetical protein